MKIAKRPYDIDFVKNTLIKKNFFQVDLLTYTHYKRMFQFLYPELSDYYIRKIVDELIDEKFFIIEKIRKRRYFRVKNYNVQKPDIGYITF